ncbi:MAG: 16S rRNA (cytidine(1402)-2'-O)-methyltransferase [Chitinivibrionales bacterium]|nr:16S rRNA (cytidine(1402)-2'-O)-methyltransferase [Chitinivibrionales bacterium]
MATLYVVATPIGNLRDMTPRALEVLRDADIVVAEDTRVSSRLLSHHGVSRPMRPYHDHNKERITPALIDELLDGKTVAVVSDAGTPGIADPAFYLVRAARAAGVTVTPIPGACAAIAALVASGLPTDRFVFENFLPPKSGKRRTALQRLASEKRTVICYESPHRLLSTLRDMAAVLGDTPVVVARELTKLHEEILRDTPARLVAHFEEHSPRGEIVLLFNTSARI